MIVLDFIIRMSLIINSYRMCDDICMNVLVSRHRCVSEQPEVESEEIQLNALLCDYF